MRRVFLLVAAGVVVFAVVAFLMVRFMPQPLKDSDYLVAGSVSTLVALLVVFLAIVSTGPRSRDVFLKRRPKRRE